MRPSVMPSVVPEVQILVPPPEVVVVVVEVPPEVMPPAHTGQK